MVEIKWASGEVVRIDVKGLEFYWGGQARVYKWREKRTKKTYALKVCYVDPDVLRRVTDIGKALSKHSEVPKAISYRGLPLGYGWGTKEEFGFQYQASGTFQVLVYNWVEGRTLDKYLEKEKALSNERIKVCRQLLDILIYLQNAGVVHGDLYPDNFMIANDGNLYLMDLEGAGLLGWDRREWVWKPTNLGKGEEFFTDPPEYFNKDLSTIFSDRWVGTYLVFFSLSGSNPIPFLKRIDRIALDQLYSVADKNVYDWPPRLKGNLPYMHEKWTVPRFQKWMNDHFGRTRFNRTLFATYVLGYREPQKRPDFQQVKMSLSGLI